MDGQLIAREAIVAIAVTLLGAVMVRLIAMAMRGRSTAGETGWTELRPTAFLLLLGAMSLAGVVVFLVGEVRDILSSARPGPAAAALDFAFLVCMGLFAWAAVIAFGVQLRFNAEGVQRSGLGAADFVPWSEIAAVRLSALRGPLLVTRTGRTIVVSEYVAGLRGLMVMAAAKGAEIDPRLSRKFRLGRTA